MVPGYVLNHVHLANVNLVDRSKDNKSNLIFVQFSTDKFQPSPSMLYSMEHIRLSRCAVRQVRPFPSKKEMTISNGNGHLMSSSSGLTKG